MSVRIEDSILTDEIGIETGRYGSLFLKTVYQPIFAPRGAAFEPVAVEAFVQPFHEGCSVDPATLFQEAGPDAAFVRCLCLALHLRNFHNIGQPTLDLFLSFNPDQGEELQTVAEELLKAADDAFDPDAGPVSLVCLLEESEGAGAEALAPAAQALRDNGIGVCLGSAGGGQAPPGLIEWVRPDMVRLDGAWFRRIAEVEAASRLFEALVASLHEKGVRVLIEGIETHAQLHVAAASGADLLQGGILGKPALAGTLFDMRAIDPLARGEGKVVRLFR